MSVLRPNVLIWTSRGSRLPSGKTDKPAPILARKPAFLGDVPQQTLMTNPKLQAFGELYELVVDSGTDVAIGDVITRITRTNGVTPWPPNDGPVEGAVGSANIIWIVRLHKEESPGLRPRRCVYVEKYRVGGPVHN